MKVEKSNAFENAACIETSLHELIEEGRNYIKMDKGEALEYLDIEENVVKLKAIVSFFMNNEDEKLRNAGATLLTKCLVDLKDHLDENDCNPLRVLMLFRYMTDGEQLIAVEQRES